VKGDIMDTMTKDDIKRAKGLKIKRLENLANACADAKDDDMKTMWYNKMMKLADKYNMRDYVMRRLVH
tara:strand:+ start:295 stop:498 length:204 start_codon:yes stop_codon:yes gene_type:complete